MNNICKKCGHKWLPKVEEPRQCPNCKSTYWRGHIVITHTRIIEPKEEEEK